MRRFRARPRLLLAASLLGVLAITGALGEAAGPLTANAASDGQDPARLACGIKKEQLLRIYRGTRADWGPDIIVQAQRPNFVSGGLSHSGPWNYLQKVPLFFYGPGIVPAVGKVSRPVLSTDIAPTQGGLLNFPFNAPDGQVLPEVLPPGGVKRLPKLLVTFVWDAAGNDVLSEWPKSWTFLRSLIPDGVWYSNATVGSSPSNTPPIHASIGTGAFPRRHGVLDEFIKVNGVMQKPQQNGPAFELLPTLADLYDRSTGNASIVGEVATLSSHLGMIGHGAMWGGGDRDIAVTREHLFAATGGAEGNAWNLTPQMKPFFRFPKYVNNISPEPAIRKVDQADGKLDGYWFRNSIERMANGFDTPARTLFQAKVSEAVLRREGFGQDKVPDLFFVNDKSVDTIGHYFSLNSREVADALRYEDENLKRFIAFLNRLVGKRQWAMVITADHGHQYDPALTGAFQIYVDKVVALVNERFSPEGGPQIVDKMRPSGIWLNPDALQASGASVAQISSFVANLTEAQTVRPNETVKPGEQGDLVFEAAFPSSILSSLPCLPSQARE